MLKMKIFLPVLIMLFSSFATARIAVVKKKESPSDAVFQGRIASVMFDDEHSVKVLLVSDSGDELLVRFSENHKFIGQAAAGAIGENATLEEGREPSFHINHALK